MKTQIQKDLEAAAYLGMSYGHYKAYQRTLAEKRKKRARKARIYNNPDYYPKAKKGIKI